VDALHQDRGAGAGETRHEHGWPQRKRGGRLAKAGFLQIETQLCDRRNAQRDPVKQPINATVGVCVRGVGCVWGWGGGYGRAG